MSEVDEPPEPPEELDPPQAARVATPRMEVSRRMLGLAMVEDGGRAASEDSAT
jgi:hypothetical protein